MKKASARLENALNAAGGPLDACSEPHPLHLSREEPLLSAKEAAIHNKTPRSKEADDLEDAIILGAESVDAPRLDSLVPVGDLLSRRKVLAEQLETMQTQGLKARSLLREVEAMVSRAIEDDLNEGFQPSSSSSLPGSARGGSRPLAPSYRPPFGGSGGSSAAYGQQQQQQLSARATAPGRNALLAAADRIGQPSPRTSGPAPASVGDRPASADSESIKARRLHQCEMLSSQLQPMREELREHDESLQTAAADNAKLAKRAASALDFSAEELAAEMAKAELDQQEDKDAAWEAEMAASRARARSRMLERRLKSAGAVRPTTSSSSSSAISSTTSAASSSSSAAAVARQQPPQAFLQQQQRRLQRQTEQRRGSSNRGSSSRGGRALDVSDSMAILEEEEDEPTLDELMRAPAPPTPSRRGQGRPQIGRAGAAGGQTDAARRLEEKLVERFGSDVLR